MGIPARAWTRGPRIGVGSFGEVSLAVDDLSGDVFAVKSVPLTSPASQSLENEIEILRTIHSPFVVAYRGDDESYGAYSGPFRNLHMEYMEGGTLADCSKTLPFDEARIKAYTRCVVSALHYLHDVAGIVHCDVKGRNVLLGPSPGTAKLADFGSSVRVLGNFSRGSVRGTVPWMAPEVARGERPMPASDMWSLGCTVIESVTGSHPWARDESEPTEATGSLFRIGYGESVPQFPQKLSKTGHDFLEKCLKRDVRERWTARELLQHPFLVEFGDMRDETPRTVFCWSNFGVSDDEDFEENRESTSSVFDCDEGAGFARRRVRELALNCGDFGWNCDGWEVIRGRAEQCSVLGENREGRERACGAFLNCIDDEFLANEKGCLTSYYFFLL